MKKRGISILLALLLLLSLLPGTALAQGGTVRVIVENRTFTETVDGFSPAWTGTLFDETVTYADGMTCQTALETAAGQAGAAPDILSSGYGDYLNGVNGLSAGDYPRKTGAYNMSGWLVALNDWYGNDGLSTAVAAGDTVRFSYSCDGGPDVGSDWSSDDVSLKALALSAGVLDPAFDPNTTTYSLTLPAGTTELTVTPTAANRYNKATVLTAGETEARWGARTVAVRSGDAVTVEIQHVGYDDPVVTSRQYRLNLTVSSAAHKCAAFTDVEDDWARAGICRMAEAGIMNGTSPTTFSPGAATTRAMLVMVLYRLAAANTQAASAPFPDTALGTWYTDAVDWAAKNDIVRGYPDGTFLPDRPVTREEAATILYRYYASGGSSGLTETLSAFTDAGSVQPYARDAMRWAVQNGVINGMSPTTLVPQGAATRAQLAAILARIVSVHTPLDAVQLYTLTKIPAPGYGDEWVVFDTARLRSGATPAYETGWYEKLAAQVSATNGTLNARYATDYARVVLTVTALGRDATNVAGYDLTAPLQDVARVTAQGVNGAIYALLALDSGSYASDVRGDYVQAILDAQLADGGYTYRDGDPADPDLTAMALQALAHCRGDAAVDAAIDKALACLSGMQRPDGGFFSWGDSSCESTAQAIIALSELGVALDDGRFVKGGSTLLDNLLTFQLKDGSFCHTKSDGTTNLYATEQAFRALVAVECGALYSVR